MELNTPWLGRTSKDCFDKFITLNRRKTNSSVKSVKSLVPTFEILIANSRMVSVNGFLKYEKKEKERKAMNKEKSKNGLRAFDTRTRKILHRATSTISFCNSKQVYHTAERNAQLRHYHSSLSYSGRSTDVRSCIRTNFCSVNRSLQFDPIRQVLDKVDKVFPKQKFFARRTSSGRSDFLIYSKNILAQQLFQTRQLFHINIIMYPFEIRPNILRNFGQHSVSFKNY